MPVHDAGSEGLVEEGGHEHRAKVEDEVGGAAPAHAHQVGSNEAPLQLKHAHRGVGGQALQLGGQPTGAEVACESKKEIGENKVPATIVAETS